MKNNDIKITSYDYAVTANIVAQLKKRQNETLQENENLSAKNRINVGFIPSAQNHYSNMINDSNVKRILKEHCFLNTLSKIYVNAIPLDESFKVDRVDIMRNHFNKILKENTNITELMTNVKDNSKFLTNLIEACDKKADKMKKEVKEDSDLRGVTAEEYVDKYMEKDDLLACDSCDIEELSEIIKDKVTEVIKTEQDNNKKDMEMVEVITNQKALGESVAVEKVGVEEYTLFKSIMINCCKQTLNETTKINDSIPGYSVLSESGNISLNMDTMLMESVVEYTRLELFNTIRMSEYNVKDIKDMCNKIAYGGYTQPY